MNTADLLIEIGTEELPTQAVDTLSQAFAKNMLAQLDKAQIAYENYFVFATPRRMTVFIKNVAKQTRAQTIEHRGPPTAAAFKQDGAPTPAAQGFADRFGISVADLAKVQTDKGEYLVFKQQQAPVATLSLLLNFIEQALHTLPIKKPMQWGDHTFKFVRPVHWVLGLLGDEIIPGEIFGQTIGRTTRGHRFLNNTAISIDKPEHYAKILYEQGFVVANFAARETLIKEKITQLAQAQNLTPVSDEALLHEVTCLVEWPVPLMGSFDKRFLALPQEVISCTLKQNQKTFVLVDDKNQLQPLFIAVANIASKDPVQVIRGNEKVVHARLSDAEFFFAQDKKQTMQDRLVKLSDVTFQHGLGHLAAKGKRISDLAQEIAIRINPQEAFLLEIGLAGLFCKADLVSAMVGEFPELQGIMGGYYAEFEKLGGAIASGIREHYQPTGANSQIPETLSGAILSIADKLDTIAGIFALGKKPSGDKDPFALKRAMSGVLRIMLEKELQLDLKDLLSLAAEYQPVANKPETLFVDLIQFAWDRFDASLREAQFPPELLNCVTTIGCTAPYDMYLRITALNDFVSRPEAASLASAHKRVNNFLAKQSPAENLLNPALFIESQERDLAQILDDKQQTIIDLCAEQQYTEALLQLAQFKPALDAFFDKVLVLCDDEALKQNRLILLKNLSDLFLQIGDLSYLPVAL